LWINEVQAENVSGILDNNGEHDPWIELYNSSGSTVSLAGLYLSPNYTNLTNWAFPPGASIGPTQFLVVFCDGQPGQTAGNEYHTSFRLSPGAGSIALSRTNATLTAALMNKTNYLAVLDYINYAGLHGDRSYGSFPDGQPYDRQEFFYVTPGGTNNGRSGPLVVFINEWMAGNANFLADPADNDYDDWFEIYNPGTNSVDIAGYYLTDTLTNKFKYLIPTNSTHVIPGHGHLLVWADNETGQNTSGGQPRPDLHVNFQLSLGGEAIGLFAADGTQIDAITFGQQTNDISQGRYPDGGPSIYFMTNPTPRAANFVAGIGNNSPTLAAIGAKTVFVGQTLTFTALATDPDPGQTLSFSLGGGAPGDASINPSSGAFSWAPSIPGTNVIPVIVTDNGIPPLNDFENVVVTVLPPPGFADAERVGTDLTLKWDALPNRIYRVLYKTNLNDVQWYQIGQDQTTPTGGLLSVPDSVTNSVERYYRLMLVQ
jgi:hypothetical protein